MTTVTLSLVSHTNVGKTTVARTLLRRDVGEVLDQAQCGYAAVTTGEWCRAFAELGRDPDRRREWGASGRRTVERHFSVRVQAVRLAGLFRALGATFIKVGQIMSTRPDLIPVHIIKALEHLQDDPVRVEGDRWNVDEKMPGEIDEGLVRPSEAIQTDLHEGIQQGNRRGLIAVGDVAVAAGIAIQQFIPEDMEISVEDCLPSDLNRVAWGFDGR